MLAKVVTITPSNSRRVSGFRIAGKPSFALKNRLGELVGCDCAGLRAPQFFQKFSMIDLGTGSCVSRLLLFMAGGPNTHERPDRRAAIGIIDILLIELGNRQKRLRRGRNP